MRRPALEETHGKTIVQRTVLCLLTYPWSPQAGFQRGSGGLVRLGRRR